MEQRVDALAHATEFGSRKVRPFAAPGHAGTGRAREGTGDEAPALAAVALALDGLAGTLGAAVFPSQ